MVRIHLPPAKSLQTISPSAAEPITCRALELSFPAGQFFLDQARVGLNFGEAFGADYAGFVRLNFATPAAILREIVRRMVEAVRRP